MNAVFIALTTYQLMVSDIYATYIFNKYHQKSYIVNVGMDTNEHCSESYSLIFVPGLERGKIKRIWKRLFYGGNLFRFSPLYKAVKRIENSYIFVFNDTEPITNKLIAYFKRKKNNKVVLVDEGIGTYTTSSISKHTFKEIIRILGTSILGSKMQYRAIGDNKLIDYVIVGNDELYKTFDKATNKVILHQSKNSIFLNSKSFIENYYGQIAGFSEFDILFLGQPFCEGKGLLDEEYNYFIAVLSELRNKSILIKPHPRDIKGKYEKLAEIFPNIKIAENNFSCIPVECLVALYNTHIIVTHSSSAAINIANMMPDVQVIMLYTLGICKELNKMTFGKSSYYSDDIFASANNNLFKLNSLSELKFFLDDNKSKGKSKNQSLSVDFPEIDTLWTI